MPIVHVPEHRLWVLSGAISSYVIHLDHDDALIGLHWGTRLDADQAASLLDYAAPRRRSCEEPSDGTLDLAVGGRLRYGHPATALRFADGTRDLDLRFTGSRIDGDELVIAFGDRHYPLTIESHYRLFGDVIERHTTLHNEGDPITVFRADSATWVVPPMDDYRLSHVRGQWAAETQLSRTRLAHGETVSTSRRGTTSHQANPWVMIDDGTATETHGAVHSAALAWSGSWQIVVERQPSERVTISAGAGHTPLAWTLGTGQALQTPPSLGLYSEGGFGGASRAWHDHIRDHVLPHPGELRPVLYNSWETTEFDVSLEGQTALADRAAALGVELFVMDDGWFGARTHDAAGLGDWTPNPDRFPGGLKPLIDHVHGLGMKFGLWFEPEMVNPDSDLYRAHPDWVLHQPHRDRTEHRNQLVLDLSRREVADHVHEAVDAVLRENPIDFIKWDMNRPFTEAGLDDRIWTDYVRNLYAVLDRLRADHPHLRIEGCSSGGGRLDLGILQRSDQIWTSDNTDAVDRLTIQHGFSQLYPAQVMGAWVTDSPNPFTGRTVPLEFRFHVAMAGALALGGDLAAWSDTDLAQAAELIAAYKGIRPLVQHGLQYRLNGSDAVQYLAKDGSQTALLAFFRSRRFGATDQTVRLQGLDPDRRYVDAATGRIHHGAVLLSRGLPLELPPGDHASALVHLHRMTQNTTNGFDFGSGNTTTVQPEP